MTLLNVSFSELGAAFLSFDSDVLLHPNSDSYARRTSDRNRPSLEAPGGNDERTLLVYGALSSHRQTDPAKFLMPLFAPRLIYSTATIRGWWLPRWVPSQPLAEVRAATSDLLTMLSKGALTPPASVRYPLNDFQEAVRLADGEAGQEKVLLDFSD